MMNGVTVAAPVHASSTRLADWPAGSRRLLRALIQRYDEPHDVTPSLAIWRYNNPWNRTVLYRNGAKHNFPLPHRDVLAQTIFYRVPAEKYQDVLTFNGSLLIDRTRGEVSALCSSEELNLVILNLMNDVVTGRRSVDEARRACAAMARHLRIGWPEPYAQQLQFVTHLDSIEPEVQAPDPDVSMLRIRR